MAAASGSLEALLRPRSIAVIGASRSPDKNGYAVVRNLVRGGFPGRVFPVNPAGGEIAGVTCWRTLGELPEPPDCAMVVIPAADTVAAVRQCADAGIRAVVVGASGFAEDGTEAGAARQEALAAIARDRGLALLGPNTNGFLNAADRVSLGYNAEHAESFPPGGVSVVSHSGALFGGFARTLRRLGGGLSKFIPVGNEAGVSLLDVLEFLVADDATTAIGLIVEAVSSGARLRLLADRARQAGKPVVALKLGRSVVGREATAAHSSRLAGRARAYDALFEACGIAAVRSVEALAGGACLLAARTERSVAGEQRLVGITTSGAGGALIADFAAERALPLAGDAAGEWPGALGVAIRAQPARGRLRNPIDTGSLGRDWSQLGELYELLERDGVTGPSAVYAHIAPHPTMDRHVAEALVARQRRTGTPIVVMAPGGLGAELERFYVGAGIPVFHDLPTGFDSLRCHFATLPRTFPPQQMPRRDDTDWRAIETMLRAAAEAAPVLSERVSADVLLRAGVPMVESRGFAAIAEGEDIAGRLGYPVVLKALVPGVAHKSALGLVAVGIGDADALRRHHHAMADRLAALGHAGNASFILQPMRRGAAELIIGLSREPALGHFLVAGWGGIHAEALDRVALLPVPTSDAAIAAWLGASPLAALLQRLDAMAPLVGALAALQGLAQHCGEIIESVDVNPFLVDAQGGIGVDALVVVRKREERQA